MKMQNFLIGEKILLFLSLKYLEQFKGEIRTGSKFSNVDHNSTAAIKIFSCTLEAFSHIMYLLFYSHCV